MELALSAPWHTLPFPPVSALPPFAWYPAMIKEFQADRVQQLVRVRAMHPTRN